jgi:hypothetical protein
LSLTARPATLKRRRSNLNRFERRRFLSTAALNFREKALVDANFRRGKEKFRAKSEIPGVFFFACTSKWNIVAYTRAKR